MPRFRFTAADASGNTHDGTIDAASEDVARNKLATNGLAVRSVSESPAADGVPVPVMPFPTAPKAESGLPDFGYGPPRSSRRVETPERGQGGASPFPIMFSLMALIVSLVTAAYTLSRDPFSGRLKKYDFSTPDAAYQSSLKMVVNGDVVAKIERDQKLLAPLASEQERTSFIKERREYQGLTILFIRYERNGKVRQEVRAYERESQTGLWRRSTRFDYDLALNRLPPDLSDAITVWVTGHEAEDGFGPAIDW